MTEMKLQPGEQKPMKIELKRPTPKKRGRPKKNAVPEQPVIELPKEDPKDITPTPTTLELKIKELERKIEDIRYAGTKDELATAESVSDIPAPDKEKPTKGTYGDLTVSWTSPEGKAVKLSTSGEFDARTFGQMVTNIPKAVSKAISGERMKNVQGRTRKSLIRQFKAREALRQRDLLRLRNDLSHLKARLNAEQ